MEIHFGM